METSRGLDTASLKEAFSAAPLDSHEKFGIGEVYQIGRIRLELFTGQETTPPIARIRMPGGILSLSDVAAITPNTEGGVLIDCAKPGQKPHCSVTITRQGDIALLYSLPPAPMRLSDNGMTRSIKGQEYVQSTVDIEGTPEGVRVQIKGVVDAAPRLVDPKNQKSPLTFFLIEDDSAHPADPVYHEVWAINQAKQELKALKLVKGYVIEAILYRHTYEVEFSNRQKETVIRHNLVKVLYVETGEGRQTAKRPKRRG
jgi:hypothetical protein